MSDFKPATLTKEEIPQGVIDDLTEHFGTVTFELDASIDENTKSMKSNYFDKDVEIVEGTVLDVEFNSVTTQGRHGKSYLVRLNETPDGVSLKQVITMAIFEPVDKEVQHYGLK